MILFTILVFLLLYSFTIMMFVSSLNDRARELQRVRSTLQVFIDDREQQNRYQLMLERKVIHLQALLHAKQAAPAPQFSKKELKLLIILCHPDKHSNSDLSNKATKKLIYLKDKA